MKKIFSLLTIICLLLAVLPANVLATENDYMTMDEAQERDNMICSLLRELDSLQDATSNAATLYRDVSASTRIYEIKSKLDELGVEIVSPTTNSNINTRAIYTENLPTLSSLSANQTWAMWTSESVLYTNGTRYDVTTVRAIPKTTSSVLYQRNVYTQHASPMLEATYCYFVEQVITSKIPTAVKEYAATVAEVVDLVEEGMATSTIIKDVTATYDYTCNTYYFFRYVTPSGSSDAATLCYVDNAADIDNIATPESLNGNSITAIKKSQHILQYDTTGTNTIQNMIQAYINKQSTGKITYSLLDKAIIRGIDKIDIQTLQIFEAETPYSLY